MCSLDDADTSGSALMERKIPNAEWSAVCQKCAVAQPVIQILQVRHAYCRTCFLSHVNHKFRSSLGKSKIMRPSDVVLASFSGSCKSHALLHLLRAGLSEKSHKRFLFKVQVLYIDEGAILGTSIAERESNLLAVGTLVSSLGFSLYFSTLSCMYGSSGPWCLPWKEGCCLQLEDEAEKNLINLFQNVDTLTSQEDLLRQLRRSLLINAAAEVGCGKIFLAETSTDLSIKILTNVSLGRGAQMYHDVSFCDDRIAAVKLIRPMCELSSKEVAFYSVYNRLNNVPIPSLGTKVDMNHSIHRLSEQFVMHLMEEFPSTVSTVFRTGEKLGSNKSTSHPDGIQKKQCCVLCYAAKETDSTDSSSVQATSFSRLISTLGPKGFDSTSLKSLLYNEGEERQADEPTESPNPDFSNQYNCLQGAAWNEVLKSLCYGCRLVFNDMKPSTSLPKRLLQISHQRVCFQAMEESIKEFLL